MALPETNPSHGPRDLCDEAAAIRSGELTAAELFREQQRNIARLDESHKVFLKLAEDRFEEAARLDDEAREGNFRGPLHGIPIAIKDNVDTVGFDTTAGSRVLAGSRPEEDALLVRRLREAGALITGKTNMDEFAYGFTTENEHFGNAANPYDPDRVAGGSSGGSALSVALGMSSGAIGTDTNGSIRVPASLCGLVGMRPTYGRVSRRGIVTLAASMDQAGPLTRSVRDAALVLSVMAGHDPLDPTSEDVPVPEYDELTAEPGSAVRAGVPRSHFFEGAEPEVISIVEDGLRALSNGGGDLVEISLPRSEKGRESAALITAVESSEAIPDAMIEGSEHLFDQKVLGRLQSRAGISASDYEEALEHAASIRTELLEALQEVDLIVTPTCPLPAIRIGEGPREIDGNLVEPSRYLGFYTSVFGLAGLPSVSVPCGFTGSGLPVGMQLIAAPFREANLLQHARMLESAMSPA